MSRGLDAERMAITVVLAGASPVELEHAALLYQDPFAGDDPIDGLDALLALARRCSPDRGYRAIFCALACALLDECTGYPRDLPRRAYATALAASGVNLAVAMALAGHKDPRTHVRYVKLAQRSEKLRAPAAALPRLPAPKALLTIGQECLPVSTASDPPSDLESADFLRRPQRELNPRYRRERPMS
jgi:hypothetical protein